MEQILKDDPRPSEFSMKIHSGVLETMGHNMYSSVAKCLAEFVANAYDADAEKVDIKMNFNEIDNAKKQVRKQAKEDKAAGIRTDISAIYDPLPTEVTIIIEDNGHGMAAQEIQDAFMSISRNRRKDGDGKSTRIFTESGKRRVMGRKGVGKLAGFGAAEHVKITSKRSGEIYATSFEMNYKDIKDKDDLTDAKFVAVYQGGLDPNSHYTKIELSQLRCDSMKSTENTIQNTLSRTFFILDKNFKILLNDEEVKDVDIDWEFSYPKGATIENMGSTMIIVDKEDEDSNFPINYIIRFRARPNDHNSDEIKAKKRASLPAERRGDRIYCHGRISHGPSLLKLHSGVHNFHGQDYMECIVIADALDEFEFDCIVTNREGLHKDNPIVNAIFESVTGLMKTALAEQYKFRDEEIGKAIEDDDFSKGILSPL